LSTIKITSVVEKAIDILTQHKIEEIKDHRLGKDSRWITWECSKCYHTKKKSLNRWFDKGKNRLDRY